jgi:hypothetical protein
VLPPSRDTGADNATNKPMPFLINVCGRAAVCPCRLVRCKAPLKFTLAARCACGREGLSAFVVGVRVVAWQSLCTHARPVPPLPVASHHTFIVWRKSHTMAQELPYAEPGTPLSDDQEFAFTVSPATQQLPGTCCMPRRLLLPRSEPSVASVRHAPCVAHALGWPLVLCDGWQP